MNNKLTMVKKGDCEKLFLNGALVGDVLDYNIQPGDYPGPKEVTLKLDVTEIETLDNEYFEKCVKKQKKSGVDATCGSCTGVMLNEIKNSISELRSIYWDMKEINRIKVDVLKVVVGAETLALILLILLR